MPEIYGPYVSEKDGRKRITIYEDDGTTHSMQYCKYLMECKLGRKLTKDETVDHIDDDKTNDDINNLQILSRADNTAKENRRRAKQRKLICTTCGYKNCICEKYGAR